MDDVAVFAVVLCVLGMVFGIAAWAVITVAGAVTRRRERKTMDLLGLVRRRARHRRCRILWGGGRHV